MPARAPERFSRTRAPVNEIVLRARLSRCLIPGTRIHTRSPSTLTEPRRLKSVLLRSLPIDSPDASRHSNPIKLFDRRASRVVIQNRRALVEPPRMRRAAETESLAVEMVAELVAEGAEKSSEGGDLFFDRRAGPEPNHPCAGSVVAEQLRGPAFANPQRASRQRSDLRLGNIVETRCGCEKVSAGGLDSRARAALHCQLNGLGEHSQSIVGG